MNAIRKKRGQYLGTRIVNRWWQSYTRGEFVTRGAGEYWIKDGCLFFQSYASQQPMILPLSKLAEIKVCPCQRRTGGVPILKLVWEQEGRWLSSGFVLSGLLDESNHLLSSLRSEGLRH